MNSFQKLIESALEKAELPDRSGETDHEIIDLTYKQSHLYKEKTKYDLPFSDMQNKLDLFNIID